ncbi:hypothetical protein J1605_010808 [Eschrichtius robustus]|uniref:Uncharacterized protein n=1 Tax=Eschrichtius robustus TaxID=9764 RepID=A0AB34GQV6_ESCRO|nr:hypothetical protein J1605_010808 [Eschrichtius robustus]
MTVSGDSQLRLCTESLEELCKLQMRSPTPHLQIELVQVLSSKPQLRGTSLVVQWLRIHLPMQGTRVRALVQEDPTCRGATKPVSHNY